MTYRVIAVRPRPKLHFREAVTAAEKLYVETYEAIASGNLKSVESHICTGMLAKVRAMAEHPRNLHIQWTLHKWLSPPRLMSYKVAVLPGPDGKPNKNKEEQMGFVQAVVRFHSLQSLRYTRTSVVRERGQQVTKETPVDVWGRELPAEEHAAAAALNRSPTEKLEYYVVQRIMKKSQEGPWKLLSSTSEATLEGWEEQMEKERRQRPAAA